MQPGKTGPAGFVLALARCRRGWALRRAGIAFVSAGALLTGVSLTQLATSLTVRAGYGAGSDCKLFGTSNYKGLSADCPTGYLPATTGVGSSYAPGQTFSFTVVVHNPTGRQISVQTAWAYTHILTIQDSKTGSPPLQTVDVADGTTPSGVVPVTDYNWFAYGMWRGRTQEVLSTSPAFTLTVPANGSVTLTRTGTFSGCGYIQTDLAATGPDAVYGLLSSGVLRYLGCRQATPPPSTTTGAVSALTASSSTSSSSPATSTGGVAGITSPGTGAGGGDAGLGLLLVSVGIGFVGAARRRPDVVPHYSDAWYEG